MFTVDTMTFGMNLEDRKKEKETITGRKVTIIDNNYVITVDAKIKSKLYLDDENRKKLQEVIEKENIAKMFLFRFRRKDLDRKFDIIRYGKDGGYGFYYNETRHTLSVHLQHWLVEDFTAEEIIENTKQKLMMFFGLTKQEINPLTLRRIDYYCDYRYRDNMELEIIKNIITKIPDQFYSYKKEITDEPQKYVVKYLALKFNRKKYGNIEFNISRKTIIDKEEDDYYEI